ncbi:MAG: LEA type 2 family protein [Brumimicrobium sp.]|nr:LEA type 2 family protein [Brumimicrobium sp.]
MRYFKILILVVIISSLTGCIEIPEFKGISNFKIEKLTQEKVSFNLDVTVFNPNGFGIKIKRSAFDLYVDEEYIGKAHLTKAFKMKRKKTTVDNVPIEIELEKGAMFKLARYITKSSVNVRLKGKLKASVFGIPRKKEIDETKTINPKDLNIKV